MEKIRKNKIITIIVLMVTIVGMSIGFAVFSNTLTISSSATVTPNEEDFNVNVYGIEDFGDDPYVTFTDISAYTSKTTTLPLLRGEVSARTATIGEGSGVNTINLSDLTVSFTQPDQSVLYSFAIKNESQYDAYLEFSDFEKIYTEGLSKTCVAGDGATESLVTAACDAIGMGLDIGVPTGVGSREVDSIFGENPDFTSSYKIESGDYVILLIFIMYNSDVRSDGPFTVTFEEVSFGLSTTA